MWDLRPEQTQVFIWWRWEKNRVWSVWWTTLGGWPSGVAGQGAHVPRCCGPRPRDPRTCRTKPLDACRPGVCQDWESCRGRLLSPRPIYIPLLSSTDPPESQCVCITFIARLLVLPCISLSFFLTVICFRWQLRKHEKISVWFVPTFKREIFADCTCLSALLSSSHERKIFRPKQQQYLGRCGSTAHQNINPQIHGCFSVNSSVFRVNIELRIHTSAKRSNIGDSSHSTSASALDLTEYLFASCFLSVIFNIWPQIEKSVFLLALLFPTVHMFAASLLPARRLGPSPAAAPPPHPAHLYSAPPRPRDPVSRSYTAAHPGSLWSTRCSGIRWLRWKWICRRMLRLSTCLLSSYFITHKIGSLLSALFFLSDPKPYHYLLCAIPENSKIQLRFVLPSICPQIHLVICFFVFTFLLIVGLANCSFCGRISSLLGKLDFFSLHTTEHLCHRDLWVRFDSQLWSVRWVFANLLSFILCVLNFIALLCLCLHNSDEN